MRRMRGPTACDTGDRGLDPRLEGGQHGDTKPRSIFEEVGTDQRPTTVTGPSTEPPDARRWVRLWLLVLFALVVAMIVIGGSRGYRLGAVHHRMGPRDRDAAAAGLRRSGRPSSTSTARARSTS
jgi:hypothetical protein